MLFLGGETGGLPCWDLIQFFAVICIGWPWRKPSLLEAKDLSKHLNVNDCKSLIESFAKVDDKVLVVINLCWAGTQSYRAMVV